MTRVSLVVGGGATVRDVDALVRRLRSQGYTVTRSRGTNHLKISRGGRLLASISSTPGDRNAFKSLKGQLRRAEARP